MFRHPMLVRKTLILAAAFALAGPVAAFAQSTMPAKRKPVHAAPVRPKAPAPLVCLRGGCVPLPPHCHAEREMTWAGPTGYEIIVCP